MGVSNTENGRNFGHCCADMCPALLIVRVVRGGWGDDGTLDTIWHTPGCGAGGVVVSMLLRLVNNEI